VATCVGDELHEVGVRMVADFFEMEGWDTYYLGANSPHQSVVETVVDRRAHLLAISATMSFHLPNIKQLIAAVRNTPEASGVKVLVGGYCFNAFPDLWRQTGADATAADAEEAVRTARRFVEGT
jgi:methanogenic corrinoid protein MtbC1